ncbi:unnamed protein product [Caenorhabditis bovis]|uniref:Uncharacterized protein n=1 Tax=Caenorhabditis bovis TaxID=2654633 RepID=A0A8S1ETM8_9PELO|nr:unnamed protein product [Caenorhabditis bovis]
MPASQTQLLDTRSKFFFFNDLKNIRTRHTDDRSQKNEESTGEKAEEAKTVNSEENAEKPKVDPALIRKLRIYVLIVAGLSFVSSFILLSQMFTSDKSITEGLTAEDFTKKGIPMNTFIEKYLNRGEVQRIIFVPTNTRAIAFLHPNAVIDGQLAKERTIVVEYPQNAQQFWADIRKAEGELGIGLTEGVRIDLYQGMTTFKLVELIIGVVILAWLGTQYGRLLRKRLLESQAAEKK